MVSTSALQDMGSVAALRTSYAPSKAPCRPRGASGLPGRSVVALVLGAPLAAPAARGAAFLDCAFLPAALFVATGGAGFFLVVVGDFFLGGLTMGDLLAAAASV